MASKIKIIASVLFLLMAAGAYAQNSLREGYYQTPGFSHHIFITPNRTDSGHGNTPENAFTTQRGSYGVMTWVGLPETKNLLWTGTANIVGDEFRVNVARRSSSNMAANDLNIPKGALAIWNILDNETFLDSSGQRWVWRRQK